MKKITAKELLKFIKDSFPQYMWIDSNETIRKYIISDEFIVGTFAGRTFYGSSYEECAIQLTDYLYKNSKGNLLVGNILKDIDFPDMNKFFEYCKYRNTILESSNKK